MNPSILITPNSGEEGKLFSIIPTDGAGDLDVVRATSATRVNSEGLIETVSLLGNELVTNGDFATDSDWTLGTGWSISLGKLISDGTVGNHAVTQTLFTTSQVGKTFILSFELISYTSGAIGLRAAGFGGVYTEIIGKNTVTDNGYHEVIVQASSASLDLVLVTVSSGCIASIDNISVKEVTTNNVPRLDYSNGSCPSILVEPQRTNLLLRSNEFDNTVYFKGINTTLTPNFGTSPDGNNNAFRLQMPTGVGTILQQGITLTTGVTYTFSIYIKALASSSFNLGLTPNFLGSITTSDSGPIVPTNQWVRYVHQVSVTTTGTYYMSIDNNNGTTSCDMLIYGAQLEAGANATSYIPTVASTVTRNADVISKSGISDLIGQTEGTLYWEGILQGQSFIDNTSRIFLSISDGTVNNRIEIYRYNNVIQYDNVVGGAIQFSAPVFTITDFTGQPLKLAITYTLNNVKVFINGVLVNTDTSALVPTCSQFMLGSNRLGISQWSGLIKNALLFKTALTNSDCEILTGTSYTSYSEMATALGYTII